MRDRIQPAREKSQLFWRRIKELADLLGVPEDLGAWGITRENAKRIAKLFLPLQAAFDQNPIPFSASKEASEILSKHVR